MATRFGLGPVFAYEWLAGSRRWQVYALRSLLVFLMFLGLACVWLGELDDSGRMSVRQLAGIGQDFYMATALILLGLVGLAAPAATAGSVCVDKARGNLMVLFTTDLSNTEIVLGKLAARLTPVLGLIACAAPMLALATLFGGVDPLLPTGAVLVCLACGVFGCTLALTLSIWGRKTHEVLLATYAFGIFWMLSALIWAAIFEVVPWAARPSWFPGQLALLPYNPAFLVLAPLNGVTGPLSIGIKEQARFCVLGLLTSALLAALSIWRIRTVVVRQAGRGEAVRRPEPPVEARPTPFGWLAGLMPSPSLDGNPVLWRECRRRRPSLWTVAVWGLYAVVASGFSLWVVVSVLAGARGGIGEGASVISGFQTAAGLLLLSVSAATSLAEERQRGSLDVLLTTPLSTRSIVMGKWLGAFRGVPPLLIWPVLIAASVTTNNGFAPILIGGLILAYGAAITSLGLALATWLPRLDWAVGLTAGLYVVVLIGAIAFGMTVFGEGPNSIGPGVAAASPFWGVGYSTGLFSGKILSTGKAVSHSVWIVVWIVVYVVVALALLLATLKTFNRCLGRTDDRCRRSGRGLDQ
ncbi:ABC transporter permease [Paludisphaera rhizosphaerae]|uniref:ABC transporter permease n=1 Tax=Paludisphaera rhizosphaerae TaxID=2711216 RepID=UPI0013EB00DC|nr:hypothetical protein [Paludisphaera rhizosphaerae]